MKPLPIVGVACHARVAGAAPQELRAELKAVCPNAPRRLNRLIELALIGAHRCVHGRALPTDTPIYTTFTSGCIGDSVQMVNNVVRGRPTMPVTFINVSSNMAGFYVAASLGLHSGNHVVSCNDFAWESALELAMLGSAKCRGLLLGAVEECVWPLPEHRERLRLPAEAAVLETSHWLLADRGAEKPLAQVRRVQRFDGDDTLAQFLSRGTPRPRAQLRVQSSRTDDAAQLSQQTGLPLWRGGEGEGFTGMPAALACCRFIERERGALLHLARGDGGAWYAVEIETAAGG